MSEGDPSGDNTLSLPRTLNPSAAENPRTAGAEPLSLAAPALSSTSGQTNESTLLQGSDGAAARANTPPIDANDHNKTHITIASSSDLTAEV